MNNAVRISFGLAKNSQALPHEHIEGIIKSNPYHNILQRPNIFSLRSDTGRINDVTNHIY